MRIPAPGLKHAVLAAVVALGLGGCVAYPAPGPYGYYAQPAYYGPAYYGPPVVGTVVIGGGGGHFHHWR